MKTSSVLPGFGLTLGVTIVYLSLIVLIPLSTIVISGAAMPWSDFWAAVSSPRALAAYRLSFGAALAAALVNVPVGMLLAWVLVRYEFPGRRVMDGLIDLPFALPTAVAGIALTALYAKTGWLGRYLDALGINVVFTPLGITLALVFVGLPFVVRTLQPVLMDLSPEIEEAAACMGANRWQTVTGLIFPVIVPSLITGFMLAFARGLGEYGSIVFISGNLPLRTEIIPLLIMTKLEQFDYRGATALALVMLVLSFLLLSLVNYSQRRMLRGRS